MDDYVRKAVELADGWEFRDKDIGLGVTVEYISFYSLDFAPGNEAYMPMVRDALAAQLVWQVDTLVAFECDVTAAVTSFYCPSQGDYQTIAVIGKDRTMNTIKAIVDSKVLEPPVKK